MEFKNKQTFTEKFLQAYDKALHEDYRFFYDDIAEYGNKNSDTAVYFIPGINGTPGQIRFILPSIVKNFGKETFVKCLHLEEFSSEKFIWDKYSIENLEKKKEKIINDLNELTRVFRRVKIFASSNGFYDFVHAYPFLSEEVKLKLEVFWSAIAPDEFKSSSWEKVFSKINGFKLGDDNWFAFPNHNFLKIFNPETSISHKWSHNGIKKNISKHDLEVRFKYFGLWWAYASIDCFNKMLKHLTRNFDEKIDVPVNFLVASHDGYWQGKSETEVLKLIDKYCANKRQIVYKKSSHLWVVVPDNLTNLDQD